MFYLFLCVTMGIFISYNYWNKFDNLFIDMISKFQIHKSVAKNTVCIQYEARKNKCRTSTNVLKNFE